MFPTYMLESCLTKLQRPTIGRDGNMGTTQSFETDLVRGIACNISQASGRVQELYAQRNVFVTTTIWLFEDIRAEPNDRIYVKDRTGVERCYLVEGSNQPQGRGVTYSIDCTLIKTPTEDPRMPPV